MLLVILAITLHLFTSLLTTVALEKSVIPTDTFHDIDGISVSPSVLHVCALTVEDDIEVGGKLTCWGNHPKMLKEFKSDV